MLYKEEYLVENIKINNINKTINSYILEQKRKFIRFNNNCRINSTIEKYDKNNNVNLYTTFYSDKRVLTHNYYLQLPNPMIENQMLEILDKNPLLIKSLGGFLEFIPLIEVIIYKYWARIGVIYKKKVLLLDQNWHEFNPQQPTEELLKIMRS